MALYDLNRAGDTPIATLKLSSIVPVNWHKFPPPVADPTPINVPTVTYNGGAGGDDVDQSTANATDNYAPRTQAEKAGMLGTTIVNDVGRARGWIEPGQPYTSVMGPTPTITTLAPATAVAGGPALVCVITGTGFTPWSTVETGKVQTDYIRYISPTEMRVAIDARRSVPGTIQVVVRDHNVRSAPKDFVFT